MRRNKTITIKEALEDLIREYNLEPKLKEASTLKIWDGITGKAIAQRTKRIFIREGVLHIYLIFKPVAGMRGRDGRAGPKRSLFKNVDFQPFSTKSKSFLSLCLFPEVVFESVEKGP